MNKCFRYLAAGCIIFSFAFFAQEANAQKKSKKKEAAEPVSAVQTVSREMKQKAEMFHAEAEKYYILEDFPKAFVLYQRSLELDPQNATAYYRLSEIFMKSDDLQKATTNAEKAIELDGANKFFYLLLAEINTKQSDFAQAAKVYEQMIANCPNTDEYLFELAALYLYQDNVTRALEIYNTIEERFGLNDQVIAQKQKLYLKQSNLEKAMEEGKKLIDAFPGEPRYVLMMVEILISNNQNDKAIPYLEELLIFDPDNSRALLILADIYRKKGETEKSNIYLNRAFEKSDLDIEPKLQVLVGIMQNLPNADLEVLSKSLADRILEAHPNDFRSFEINGDLAMKLGEDQKALDFYKKALDTGSPNYNSWQNVLQLQSKMGQFKDVIKDGEAALEVFPNQAGICWFLGTAYFIEKDYEAATEVFERGKKLAGNNEELKSYFNAQLGDAYNNLKNYKKSDESYEAALAFDPNNDHVLNNYSYFLSLRKEKLDLAKKMSLKVVMRNPDNPTYLDTHAWVLYVRGEFKEAKTYIEKAVNSGKDLSGTIIEHYGDILFKLGDVESAVKQWQKAKGMDDTSELIDKKIADRKLYE